MAIASPLMDLRVFIEPQQGASYERVLTLARVAERLGYDGFFSSDHYLKMSDISGLPGPLDTWTTLAGLARDTSRLRLGPLVTPVTFRLPGPLAIAVAQIELPPLLRWHREDWGWSDHPPARRAPQVEVLIDALAGAARSWR